MSAMDLRCQGCGAPVERDGDALKRACDCPANTAVSAHLSAVCTGKAAIAGEAPG